jgi:hypothetical protein
MQMPPGSAMASRRAATLTPSPNMKSESDVVNAGALAVIRHAKIHGTGRRPWLTALLGRRPTKVAAIALANKIARVAWAMMAKGERYKQPAVLAR